ncbi:hypothetical protein TWF788_000744 [Orbilia oligospora]|nr:hypothetical protein TWF788_000744 [Orbilia oligospora]
MASEKQRKEKQIRAWQELEELPPVQTQLGGLSSDTQAVMAMRTRAECINANLLTGFRYGPVQIPPDFIPRLLNDPVKIIRGSFQAFGCDIKDCTNPKCADSKKRFKPIVPNVPESRWLQNFILNVISCWTTASYIWTETFVGLNIVKSFCEWVLNLLSDSPLTSLESGTDPGRLLPICELFYFALVKMHEADLVAGKHNYSQGVGTPTQLVLSPPMIELGVYSCRAIDDVPEGVCKHRLWNLASFSKRGLIELLTISRLLGEKRCKLSGPHHLDKHRACNVQVCQLNDENTTNIPQRHSDCCGSKDCPTVEFSQAKLNKIDIRKISEPGATAWTLDEKHPQLGAEDYLAISHVWANGTGVGEHAPGKVNRCLFRYFKSIAEELGCKGIWWDTISIPSDKERRVEAIRNMHNNYSGAKHTVICDSELMDFEWTDDGHPCLALALSTWFSRGWTALELRSSRSISVIFNRKDPNGNRRVLKDLDSDIIRPSNRLYAHPAWKSVADHISWLRHGQANIGRRCTSDIMAVGQGRDLFQTTNITNEEVPMTFDVRLENHIFTLDSLLSTLKPRYTCWARDRIIIAALLVGSPLRLVSNSDIPHFVFDTETEWFDPKGSHADITKIILIKIGSFCPLSLLHDQVPISESGPWSWCPPSLFNFGARSYLPSKDIQKLTLEPNGHLYGPWDVIGLSYDAADRFKPHALHPYLRSRITAALRDPTGFCLLNSQETHLYKDRKSDEAFYSRSLPFILVKEIRDSSNEEFTAYQYIGVVIGQLPPNSRIYFDKNCRL